MRFAVILIWLLPILLSFRWLSGNTVSDAVCPPENKKVSFSETFLPVNGLEPLQA